MIGEIKLAPPSETGTSPGDQAQATAAPVEEAKTPETGKIPENVATKNDIVTIEQRQGQLSKELQELQTMIRDVQQKTNSMFNVSFSPKSTKKYYTAFLKNDFRIRARQ